MKILVAEDEPIMLKTIELRLRKDGHTVISAGNGVAALEEIEREAPDLIITDILMPFSAGLDLVSQVKEGGKKTPVIVLSVLGQENVIMEAFSRGADDYITKPFSPNELSMRVRRFAQVPVKA